MATSALRFYEAQGLVHATRSGGGQRRYGRDTLRRVSFIRIAQQVGLSLEEIRTALSSLPAAAPRRPGTGSGSPQLAARPASQRQGREDG